MHSQHSTLYVPMTAVIMDYYSGCFTNLSSLKECELCLLYLLCVYVVHSYTHSILAYLYLCGKYLINIYGLISYECINRWQVWAQWSFILSLNYTKQEFVSRCRVRKGHSRKRGLHCKGKEVWEKRVCQNHDEQFHTVGKKVQGKFFIKRRWKNKKNIQSIYKKNWYYFELNSMTILVKVFKLPLQENVGIRISIY